MGHQQKAQRQLKQGDVQTVASSSGPPLLLSVDINPVACAAASVTNRVNGTACHADSVAASLASAFRKRIADLVTFNPVGKRRFGVNVFFHISSVRFSALCRFTR